MLLTPFFVLYLIYPKNLLKKASIFISLQNILNLNGPKEIGNPAFCIDISQHMLSVFKGKLFFSTQVNVGAKRITNELIYYSKNFLKSGSIGEKTINRIKVLHSDSFLNAATALGVKAKVASLLKNEALEVYSVPKNVRAKRGISKCMGNIAATNATSAIVANIAAASELEYSSLVFANFYDNVFFGNTLYPAVISACEQNKALEGDTALKAMVLLEEIRVLIYKFLQKQTLYPSINLTAVCDSFAVLLVYAALLDIKPEFVEQAVNISFSHFSPFMSSSKYDAISSALAIEVALNSIERSERGFRGPYNIFENEAGPFQYGSESQEVSLNFNYSDQDEFIIDKFSEIKNGCITTPYLAINDALLKIFSDRLSERISLPDLEKIEVECSNAREPENLSTRIEASKSLRFVTAKLISKVLSSGYAGEIDRKLFIRKALNLNEMDFTRMSVANEISNSLWNKTTVINLDPVDQKIEAVGPRKSEADGSAGQAQVRLYMKGGLTIDSGRCTHSPSEDKDIKDSFFPEKIKLLGLASFKDYQLENLRKKLDNFEKLTNKELQYLNLCPIKYLTKSIEEM